VVLHGVIPWACVIEGDEKRYQRCEKWFSIVNFSYVEIIIIGRQKVGNVYQAFQFGNLIILRILDK
jgi:hypothetical protein